MPRRYIRKRANSFVYAFRGIVTLVRTQPNAVIHLFATIAAITLGWYFKLSSGEWIAITLSIALVWIVEAINTAIEFLTNLVSPEYNPLAGKTKDVAAAAVLIAALFAIIVGCIVFLPKIIMAFS
jgi:diacylglycerol kinase